jgi:thioesterase domain-containing protein
MCNGVLIAQEMIRQLESQGEKVALFAILDTWVLENSQVKILWKMQYYKDRLTMLCRLPIKEQLSQASRVLRRLRTPRQSPTEWSRSYWPGEQFEAPSFDAPVLLFKRPRQPFFYVRDPEMGWGTRSRGGVEICEVHCGHFEILRQPHVLVVAQRLCARMDQVNERVKQGALQFSLVPRGTESGSQSSVAESVA